MDTPQPPVLKLMGDIDLHAVRILGEPLNDLIGSSAAAVVVDVSEVAFMDSTALGALIRTHRRLRRQERKLVLVCPPGPVLTLLQVTNLLDTFDPVPDPDAAHQVAKAFIEQAVTWE